jgi:hypothetical protein
MAGMASSYSSTSALPGNERIGACTPEQRRPIVRTMHHIVETRAELLDSYASFDDLFRVIDYYSDEPDAASPCESFPG